MPAASFARQVVVVTGASAGIGRAVAQAFGARGATVALIARGETGLQAAAEEIRRAGGTALVLPCDVSDYQQVRDAAERVETELGPISVWVNVAFTSIFAPFWKIEPREFRRVTEVTYLGFVHGTHAALQPMMRRDHGTIVQVGSALAYRGIPLQSAYCGAKHATQGFHESLRTELLHEGSGVHVTMVQMPGVNTPQFSWVRSRLPDKAQPVPPIYRPELVAQAVLHAAAHPKRREYWVGSSTAGTLAANAVVPGLLDRYLARTGFKGQQRPGQPEDPDRLDNLFEPMDGRDGHDFGAHGEFDDQEITRDPQLWASRHHGLLAALAAAGAGLLGAATLRRAR